MRWSIWDIWIDRDPPSWEWPSFATYRRSIFDWKVEPDLQTDVKVIDAATADALVLTSTGIQLQGRILAMHSERRSELA